MPPATLAPSVGCHLSHPQPLSLPLPLPALAPTCCCLQRCGGRRRHRLPPIYRLPPAPRPGGLRRRLAQRARAAPRLPGGRAQHARQAAAPRRAEGGAAGGAGSHLLVRGCSSACLHVCMLSPCLWAAAAAGLHAHHPCFTAHSAPHGRRLYVPPKLCLTNLQVSHAKW